MACPNHKFCPELKCRHENICLKNILKATVEIQPPKDVRLENNLRRRKFKYNDDCGGLKENCQKDTACQIIGQCILTLDFVVANQELFRQVALCQTNKELIRLFKKYNPHPMRSYYFSGRKKL